MPEGCPAGFGTACASSCWCRRASIPCARGRKMPVPDPRPSEKIAKLFPQIDPLKDSSQRPAERRAANVQTARAPKPAPAATASAVHRPPTRCRCRNARPNFDRRREARRLSPVAPSPTPMKRTFDHDRGAIGTRRGASALERGRARAVGERRQADQAAAKKAARPEGSKPLHVSGTRRPRPSRAASIRQRSPPAKILPAPSRSRRRWRRSDAASARNFRADGNRSMPGSICTA